MDVGVSKNRDTPKSSILIGFSIVNHPFWGPIPIFGNIHVDMMWVLDEETAASGILVDAAMTKKMSKNLLLSAQVFPFLPSSCDKLV